MNTPSYIQQQKGQVSIIMRPLYERLGFTPRNYADWFSDRTKLLKLERGKDFVLTTEGQKVNHLVPVPVAKAVLGTVFKSRALPVIAEIDYFLSVAQESGTTAAAEPENAGVGTLFPEDGPTVDDADERATEARKLLTDGPVPVMLIEGKAAIKADDLVNLWSKGSFVYDWMRSRVGKYYLTLGKHYVEYKAVIPGRPRKGVCYILSIDAAIEIAKGEKGAKGRPVADYLTELKKSLKRQGLPARAKLSDFIGFQPDEEEKQPETPHFDQTIQETEPIPAADQSGSQADTEAPEVASSEAPQSDEDFQETMKNPDPETGSFFDLMVKFAQGLLQQAQGLAELHQQLQQTRDTVSALVGIEQEAARAKMGLHRGTAEIPAVTLRDKIRHAVTKRATTTKEEYDSIYKLIYKRLNYDYGISVGDFPRYKDETHLGLCERFGLLDKVWQIVQGPEFNQYAASQPQSV